MRHSIDNPPSIKLRLSALSFYTLLTPADKIIFALMLVFTIASFGAYHWFQETGEVVMIDIDGQPFARLSLWQPCVMRVPGAVGEVVVQVHHGTVRVMNSSCPQKTCIHRGGIHRAGDMIICAPNRVVIRVRAFDAKSFDLITG